MIKNIALVTLTIIVTLLVLYPQWVLMQVTTVVAEVENQKAELEEDNAYLQQLIK